MTVVKYEERTVIPLPNGDEIPATVTVRQEDSGTWTRIVPDVSPVVPASGIAEELGAEHDFIHDLEASGVRGTSEMVKLFIRVWERDHGA